MPRHHDYHRLSVSAVVDETADARSFVLDMPTALREAFAYAAGQFCSFRAILDGDSVVRCYSMSSSPDAGDPFTVTVKRVPGGRMSNWMNDALSPGDSIEVMPPSGRFVLRAAERPIVAFAGGSGITPIVSIIKTALLTTQREITLVYANRDATRVIFADALERLRATSDGRLSIHHHLDAQSGFLDASTCATLIGDRSGADFFVCGPGPFMDVVVAGLARQGVDRDRVFIERFELPDDAPGATNDADGTEVESIVIRLDRRKHTIPYEPGDTLLGAARRAGLQPPFSCQAGNCATCMAFLEQGRATMRANNALDEAEVEEGWILTCQAIPTSRELVVDYDR